MFSSVSKIIGKFLLLFSLLLCLPLGIAAYCEYVLPSQKHLQPHSTHAFLLSISITLLGAAFFLLCGRKAGGKIYRREGFLSVVLLWTIIPAFAALPFVLNHSPKNFYAAYFEAVSGLTTTGSSAFMAKRFNSTSTQEIPYEVTVPGVRPTRYIFFGNIDPVRDPETGEILYEGLEAIGTALLFWRSFLQWLGGVGIVVLLIAVLPALGVGGKILFQTEMPGPIKDGLSPTTRETALQLLRVYIALSAVEVVLLMVSNRELPFFDGLTIMFAALATGGFSIHSDSIGHYAPITQWIVVFCMVIGSINFSIYFYAAQRRFYKIYGMELLLFLVFVLVGSGLVVSQLVGTPIHSGDLNQSESSFILSDSLRFGTFEFISAVTTTGFFIANYDVWPYTTQMLLLIAMFVGGMSGSTAGGIKTIRHYMFFRILQHHVESLFRPDHVRILRIGGKSLDSRSAVSVLCFFLVVTMVATLGTAAFIWIDVDPETSIGMVTSLMNNAGMAFRVNGPLYSCCFLSNTGLNLASLLMLLGRLEFLTFFAVLVPAFWKKNS